MLSLREIGLSADDIRAWFEREIQPKNVKVDGDQIYCSCPIPGHNHKHGDKNPSFSFNCEQGVWTCHSSGDFGNIKDLCEKCGVPTPWHGKGKIPARETVYVYENADGQPVYEVVRTDDPSGKKIFQRAILSNGERKNSMKGVERVPYRLPELLKAQASNQPIFIVEGEKCAETLRGLDLVATTNSGGAGKWGDCGKYFQERTSVVIVPDNDEPGRRHAHEVATDLKQRGCNVKVLNLPDLPIKGDIYDWLKAGHKKEDLLGLVERCEEWSSGQVEVEDVQEPESERGFRLIRAGDMELREPTFVVDKLIEENALALVYGEPESGKSLLTLDISCCVATGLPFHGRHVREGSVIYIAGEGFSGLKRRLTAWEKLNEVSIKDAPLYLSSMPAALTDSFSVSEVLSAIEEVTEQAGNPQLIVIDTLARNFGVGDENSTRDMNQFINGLDVIKNHYHCTILIVHHSGLSDKGRARGSSALKGAVDVQFQVEANGIHHTLSCQKAKDMEKPAPLYFERVSVDVMETQQGEIVTSPALVACDDEPREKRSRLSANEQLGLQTFLAAAKEKGRMDSLGRFQGVHIEDWRPYFYEKSTADLQDSKRRIFNDTRKRLVQKGELEVSNDFYKLAGENAELIENELAKEIKKKQDTTGSDRDYSGSAPGTPGSQSERDREGAGEGVYNTPSAPGTPDGRDRKNKDVTSGAKKPFPPIQEKQKSAGNLLEIFPGGFESRKCNSLDRFLTTIQKKGDDRVENSQLKKLKPWESEQKPSQPSIPKSPPEDWAAWLESSEPAVKEKYNEVYDRLSKFISPEQALKKAYQRAWEFSRQLERKPA
jgi:KaiC/GvpD/RAD55 family RecA-like ATPase